MLELYEDHLVSVPCASWCSFLCFSHYSELSKCVNVGIWLIILLAISTREISGAAGARKRFRREDSMTKGETDKKKNDQGGLSQHTVICRGKIDPLKSEIPSLIWRILGVHPSALP